MIWTIGSDMFIQTSKSSKRLITFIFLTTQAFELDFWLSSGTFSKTVTDSKKFKIGVYVSNFPAIINSFLGNELCLAD